MMKKKLLFSFKYTLFCTFLVFLLLTLMGKHYRFDEGFFIPLIASFSAAFASGIIFSKEQPIRFFHIKTGAVALLLTFILAFFLFYIIYGQGAGSKALVAVFESFSDGILIMIPGFLLLTYLAETKKPKDSDEEDGLLESRMEIDKGIAHSNNSEVM